MDWSNPSKQQIEMLVTGMRACFPDEKSLYRFINAEDRKFWVIMPLLPLTIEQLLRYYVESAIEQGFVGRLYAKLREMPQFTTSIDVQRFIQLADDEGQRIERMKRQGVWPPKPKAEVVVVEPGTNRESPQRHFWLRYDDIERMTKDIIQRFPNLATFSLYLSNEKVDFPVPPLDFSPKSFERLLRAYVQVASDEDFVHKLYDKYKEMPPYISTLEKYTQLSESKEQAVEDRPKRRGWWNETSFKTVAVAEPKPASGKSAVAEPNWDDLSGKQLAFIREAIVRAYPHARDFDMFLSDKFDKRPLSTHSQSSGFDQQLFDFLQDVVAQGWAKKLVKELEKTKRVAVKNLTQALGKRRR